jgi:AcrR family transcriptional regulator
MRRPRRRHDQYLDELETFVLAEGFRHLTLADICSTLRCSRRTLYQLAPTKDELIGLVVERRLARSLQAGIDHAETAETAIEQLRAFGTGLIANASQMGDRFLRDVMATSSARQIVHRFDRECADAAERLVAAGQQRGELRFTQPGLVGLVVIAAMHAIQDPSNADRLGLTYVEASIQLMALLLDGLEA